MSCPVLVGLTSASAPRRPVKVIRAAWARDDEENARARRLVARWLRKFRRRENILMDLFEEKGEDIHKLRRGSWRIERTGTEYPCANQSFGSIWLTRAREEAAFRVFATHLRLKENQHVSIKSHTSNTIPIEDSVLISTRTRSFL
jgi:hypothetical protein